MIRTLKISAAVAIAGAFSVAQAATCPSESYGAISFKSYGSNKCVAIIDATGDQHNEAINIPNTVTVDSVYYFRNGAEDVMNANSTVMLPFDVKKGCKIDGSTLKRITSITYNATDAVWRARADYIDMTKDSLTANTPYLFSYTHGLVKDGIGYIGFGGNCTFKLNTSVTNNQKFDASIDNMKQPTGLSGTWTFKGTYEKVEFDENTSKNAYGFAAKTEGKFGIGQFVKAGPNASVPPMRAYLVYNSQGTLAKAAPGLSFAPAAEVLPASISVVMMSAEEPDDDVPATEECFQDGDGIFEVKTIDGKKVACIDGKSEARLQTLSIPEDVTVDSIAYNREFKQDTKSTIMFPFNIKAGCSENASFYEIAYIKNERTDLPQGSWALYLGRPQEWIGIQANKPYIIQANSTIKFNTNAWGIPCNYVLNTSTGSTKTSFTANFENSDSGLPGTWEFTGTYEKITFNESTKRGVYGFVAKQDTVDGKVFSAGQFIKAGTGASVPPMRAYLKYNAAGTLAKGAASTGIAEEDLPETIVVKFLNTDGEVTAIGQMNTTTGEISMDENKWFDMKGRMMNKKPTVKGTYYNKGQKVIIK